MEREMTYAQKAEEEMDRLWENGTINEQVIEQWGKEHMRTPYKLQSTSTARVSRPSLTDVKQ